MSKHIDPSQALALAALPERDAERVEASAHAAECPACRALLDEGAELLRWIDEERPEPSVDGALKARVRAAVFARPEARLRWEHLALAACALASLALALVDGRSGGPAVPAIGLHCLLTELALGMAPIAALALLARAPLAALPPRRVALLAGGFALLEQLILRTRCPVHDAALHLLAFHVSGVWLAALLGAAAARWLRRLR